MPSIWKWIGTRQGYALQWKISSLRLYRPIGSFGTDRKPANRFVMFRSLSSWGLFLKLRNLEGRYLHETRYPFLTLGDMLHDIGFVLSQVKLALLFSAVRPHAAEGEGQALSLLFFDWRLLQIVEEFDTIS
nr:Unknown Function [uncultured bacterium]